MPSTGPRCAKPGWAGCCSAAGSPTSRPGSPWCWCSACSAGGCSRAGTRSCPRSPGSSRRQPKPVSIVLSAGPPLPNFVGQDKAVAEQWAAANGVKLNEVPAAHSDQPVNTVVKQSEPPGSAFTNGEVITIQFSQGPPMVDIPNVVGLRVPKAGDILRRAGFVVQINQVGPFNVVFSESPTGQAPKGSTITLTTGFPHFG